MKERKLLVITHGDFGTELIKSVEMIMGKQEMIVSLGLHPGESVDDLREQAHNILKEHDKAGYETIILCDLLGGSPSNVALSCLAQGSYKLIMGVSMPLLIELIQNLRDIEDVQTLCEDAIDVAHASTKLIARP